MAFRFVSNVDGIDFAEATRDLDPAETLFIVSSKTFTTLETMTNGKRTARQGPGLAALGDESAVAKHFVAVSTNEAAVRGVRHRPGQHVRLLGLGGRPLLDGLGDRAVDDARHRAGGVPRDARRLPGPWTSTSARRRSSATRLVLKGFLAVWYGDFGAQTVAVLPYARVPRALPGLSPAAHDGVERQRVTLEGAPVDYETGAASTGASRARTASTPSTSSSTRARS